ncbi:MAG: hypothetical protein ACR2GY_12815 [Phycisphaerales bacterium]
MIERIPLLLAHSLAEGAHLDGLEPLAADAVPEPYRSLLVHERDMTSALEAFTRGRILLRQIASQRIGNILARTVLLVRDDAEQQPVEFGAIRIHLGAFSEAIQQEILDGKEPLGGILNRAGFAHRSQPSGWFRVQADGFVARHLGLAQPALLYGRHNILLGAHDNVRLAEVVEVLPPLDEPAFDTPVIGT